VANLTLTTNRPATLDLATRSGEARLVILRVYGAACQSSRIDPEDFVQDVLLTLHRRQSQPSRYDPTRSGWAHYVCIVARTVLSHARKNRRRHAEQWLSLSLTQVDDREDTRDPLIHLTADPESDDPAILADLERIATVTGNRDAATLVHAAPLLLAGESLSATTRKLGVSTMRIKRGLQHVSSHV
jgi:DNA-directed RNA polymerase specialized sigma24 family protein